MKKRGEFFSGTSNLVLPGARATFPEAFREKSRLEYYAYLFRSLEVNSSFYKTPKAATVAKWAETVPPDFRFSFKLSKTITHAKGFDFNADQIRPFMEAIAPAMEKSGMLLVQMPPSVTIEKIDKLQELLEEINWHTEIAWPVAVEFRHSSWYEKETEEILSEYNACAVRHDMPASAPPRQFDKNKNVFLRYHGPGGKYRGSYEDDFLQNEASEIKRLLKDGKTVYAYFNNTIGDAFNNLQSLNAMVAEQ